ncbi:hypothetical protein K492DRAFT_176723 [Lichtheimia hyalospora FSU 10163]|nr:hypothetical protein K492DRAFT_176723 [Lichtheimia hyalospora FSU 10163]
MNNIVMFTPGTPVAAPPGGAPPQVMVMPGGQPPPPNPDPPAPPPEDKPPPPPKLVQGPPTWTRPREPVSANKPVPHMECIIL